MPRRTVATLAVSAAVLMPAGPALAGGHLKRNYLHRYHRVAKRFGHRAPGRNIVKLGVVRHHRARPARRVEIRASMHVLDRMLHPAILARFLVATGPYTPLAGIGTLRAPAGGVLAGIRACESGGDYSTNTGNGFYGAYQFDVRTWRSVGGQGLPSNASPAEQDRLAAKLHAERGSSPWPVCGR